MTTDDTVQFIFDGKGESQDQFRLVATNSLKKAGTRSKYRNNDTNNMNGLRVKLTYTFCGAGMMASIFISVLGLNEREMPDDDCISLTIPGLCVGGGGVTVGSKECGTLLFMRGDSGSDKKRYQIYRDKVLIPFVKKLRTEFGDWMDGTPVPEEQRVVSWCDGDLAQIDNIVSEDSLAIYEGNLISTCKQNAARSGTEQWADLIKVFPNMQKAQKPISVSDVCVDLHHLKRLVSKELQNLSDVGKLKLKPSKKNAIIDFVSSIPEMTAKSATRNGILH